MNTFSESIEFVLNTVKAIVNSPLKAITIPSTNLSINYGLKSTQCVAVGVLTIALSLLKVDDDVDELLDGFVVLIFHTISIRALVGTYKLQAMADNIVKSLVAVVEVDNLAVDVRGANLLHAPFPELHDGSITDHLLESLLKGLVLTHYFFERFLIFHTISIRPIPGTFKQGIQKALRRISVIRLLMLQTNLVSLKLQGLY